jgi:protein-S-isoprenylcysteine O-methyltransferase Ste14
MKYHHPLRSYSLVAAQCLFIGLLLLTGPLLSFKLLWLQIIAVLLGIWAVQTMHLGHFNIVPDPRPDTQLVEAGPYRWIRHPMYASILLYFLPLILIDFTPIRFVFYAALVIFLWLKLSYEERLLSEKLPDYADYRLRTKKWIPFIF